MRFFNYEYFEKEMLLSGRVQMILFAVAFAVYTIRCYCLPTTRKKNRINNPFITNKKLSPKDRIVIGTLIV
jgi:hypothetical protein